MSAAIAILFAASGMFAIASAAGPTTHVSTSGRYHIDLPGNGLPRDVQLAPPTDVMHDDGAPSTGTTGGSVNESGTFSCGGVPAVVIGLGQSYSGTAQGTADFGLLRVHADAGTTNSPASIVCPDTPPIAGYSGRSFTTASATFEDDVTVGSASGLPAGTPKHLHFTAVLAASASGNGSYGGSDPTHAVVQYSISASVLVGSPSVNTSFDAGIASTFPSNGQSSGEADVTVGTVVRFTGSLTATAQAAGNGAADATADASNTAHAFIDSDDPDVVLTSASLHDYRSGAVSSTTTTTTPGTSSTTSTLAPGTTVQPLSGKSMLLKDSLVPKKRKAVFTSKDPAFSITGFDPRMGGAEVRLFGPNTGSSDVWTLPATGWTFKKRAYHYADGSQAHGPVVAASLANGKITVKAKGAGITYPLLGTVPQQAIAVALVFPASPATPNAVVCADFPGTRGAIKSDTPKKGVFKAVDADAPATCRALR
ncbi:MAG TPA: hypothetical protein VGR62_25720 [Candidatus Binatia bacterium]|nr:hypothetical protein [Candidatus Binatia bacterium]